MTDILTITLNPTVDLSTATPHVTAGPKLRCTTPVADPGGGGINVSRAIKFLDGTSKAFIATGGETGTRLLRLLANEHIDFTAFSVTGETRQSLSVTDESTGAQYRFVMPGPEWTDDMVAYALTAIAEAMPEKGIVVLSGSQPPGVPVDFPSRLAATIAVHHARIIVDTSGAPLAHLATHPANPFVLRMDDDEAEDLAGRSLSSREDTADFASELVAMGVAQNAIIARGSEGSILANAHGRWHCARAVAARDVLSVIGAGDSFIGAFALALARGDAIKEALRYGTAAAAAAVLTEGTRLCNADDVHALLRDCTYEAL